MFSSLPWAPASVQLYGQTREARLSVGAVARVDGDFVHVKSDDEEVRIRIW